jgi:hypothetical protein
MKKLRKNKAYSLYHTAWFLARQCTGCTCLQYKIINNKYTTTRDFQGIVYKFKKPRSSRWTNGAFTSVFTSEQEWEN